MSVRPSVCPSISQQHRRARRRPASHSTRRRRQHQRSRESVRSAHRASTSSLVDAMFNASLRDDLCRNTFIDRSSEMEMEMDRTVASTMFTAF